MVRRIGDEVDVCCGQFAANEANVIVIAFDLKVGVNGFVLGRADDVTRMVVLLDLLENPARREAFRGPAQALAQKYDLSRNLEETLEVFGKLK